MPSVRASQSLAIFTTPSYHNLLYSRRVKNHLLSLLVSLRVQLQRYEPALSLKVGSLTIFIKAAVHLSTASTIKGSSSAEKVPKGLFLSRFPVPINNLCNVYKKSIPQLAIVKGTIQFSAHGLGSVYIHSKHGH